MARVDLWVPEDQLDDARLVMLATEIDVVLAAPSEWAGSERQLRRPWLMWTARGLLVVAGLATLVQFVAD